MTKSGGGRWSASRQRTRPLPRVPWPAATAGLAAVATAVVVGIAVQGPPPTKRPAAGPVATAISAATRGCLVSASPTPTADSQVIWATMQTAAARRHATVQQYQPPIGMSDVGAADGANLILTAVTSQCAAIVVDPAITDGTCEKAGAAYSRINFLCFGDAQSKQLSNVTRGSSSLPLAPQIVTFADAHL